MLDVYKKYYIYIYLDLSEGISQYSSHNFHLRNVNSLSIMSLVSVSYDCVLNSPL